MDDDGRSKGDLGLSAATVVGLLNAVAILLAIAWLWQVVRGQQHGITIYGSGVSSFVSRIDIAFQSLALLAYAAVIGALAQIVALLTRRRDA